MVNGIFAWTVLLLSLGITVASDQAAPAARESEEHTQDVTSTSPASTSSIGIISTVASSSDVNASIPIPGLNTVTCYGNVGVGEVNCRYHADTKHRDKTDRETCRELADYYNTDLATFFKLNPTLLPDCSNIQADTEYCVAGCRSQRNWISRHGRMTRLETDDTIPREQSSSHSGHMMGSAAPLIATPPA
jgi:hypothetical protein